MFNDELLFAIYVTLGRNRPLNYWGLRDWRGGKGFLHVAARRALQAHLTRAEHDDWTTNIRAAVRRFEVLATLPETAHALSYHARQFLYPSHHSSRTSVLGDPISGLVCDAIVAYHRPREILGSLCELDKILAGRHNPFWRDTAHIIQVLAACYLGDIGVLHTVVGDDGNLAKDPDHYSLVLPGLMLVAQQGHVHMMRYLLNAGFDVNDAASVIHAAARSGSYELLDLLLCPTYGLKREAYHYLNALHAASTHWDTTTRLKNVKLLYFAAEGLQQPGTRQMLLVGACRFDDWELARWLITMGPIDVYHCESERLSSITNMPLLAWLAQEGKQEWLEWLLQLQPPKVLEHETHSRVLDKALTSAAYRNHLNIFNHLAKFFEHDQGLLCMKSAYAEDGLQNWAACYPALELQKVLMSGCRVPAVCETVGAHALLHAIQLARTSNVQWLLERGVWRHHAVLNCQSYKRKTAAYEAIHDLLIHHGVPTFTVVGHHFSQEPDGSVTLSSSRTAEICAC